MARSSHGSRRALPWAVAQRPRPMPRVVRLGRAANDNTRLRNRWTRLIVIGAAAAAVVLAAGEWIFRQI
jgi:hypothetical protein